MKSIKLDSSIIHRCSIEVEIDETFIIDDIQYICKEMEYLIDCEGCCFNRNRICISMQCMSNHRNDGKYVHFKEVKPNNLK